MEAGSTVKAVVIIQVRGGGGLEKLNESPIGPQLLSGPAGILKEGPLTLTTEL